MRVAIVDRSLVDSRGHHLGLQKSYTTALWGANVNVAWITNKLFSEHESIPTKCHFTYSAYSRDSIHDHLSQTTQEYDSLFSNANRNDIDAFFIHTASKVDYMALASIAGKYKQIPLLVCTPYYPLYMPGSGDAQSVARSMIRLQQMSNVKLFTETLELSDNYLALSIHAKHMGIPVHSFIMDDTYSKMLNSKYNSVSIAYLGAARAEKGFSDFVALAKAICSESRFYNIVSRITACISHPINTPSKEVICAIDSIKKLSLCDTRIDLIDSVQPNDEYLKVLGETTLVWLGYNPLCYANGRGSGILVDSLLNSCSIAVSRGMSAQYYLFGNGFLLENRMKSNIEAFDSFVNRLGSAKIAAKSMREKVIHEYSGSRIACKILSACTKA
jgi:hypothetical protein